MKVCAVNRAELALSISIFQGLLNDVLRIQERDLNCRGCVHSDKSTPAKCEKFQMVPPPEVQAAGCDDWVWDEIPF